MCNEESKFSIDKAIALTYEITQSCGQKGRINYLKLVKLLYLTERQHFQSYGTFITNDSFVSMRYGPVLSRTYNAIKHDLDDEQEQGRWDTYFNTIIETSRKIYDLEIIAYLENHELSNSEKIVTEVIADAFGKFREFELVDCLHHTIPEWDSNIGSSSAPISPEAIKKNIQPLSIKDIKKLIEA